MRIAVIDVAAEHGGALTILNEFYHEIRGRYPDLQWDIFVSVVPLEETDHIHVLCYSWVKKSWLHRLYFDRFMLPRILKGNKYDIIFSLQNLTVRAPADMRQVVYLHQPIPFSAIKTSLVRTPVPWIYQHILSRNIYQSVRAAERVIVQTEWMKDSVIWKTGVSGDKIKVIPPAVSIHTTRRYQKPERGCRFFYPANFSAHKNHKVIFQAVFLLNQRGFRDYQVILTGNGSELPGCLASDEPTSPIRFCGRLSFDEVLERYAESVLLFPSLVESYGLPVAEAAQMGAPIIVSDRPYAHEILAGYPNVTYIDPEEPEALARVMADHISGRVTAIPTHSWQLAASTDGWKEVVSLLIRNG